MKLYLNFLNWRAFYVLMRLMLDWSVCRCSPCWQWRTFCDLTWFCASLNKKAAFTRKKKVKNWKPAGVVCVCVCVCVCMCFFFFFLNVFLFLFLGLFCSLELCSGAIFHFNKRISELFLTAVYLYFNFPTFPQNTNPCRIQNCPWLCLCLFIDLYIEILFCIVHSLLSWL